MGIREGVVLSHYIVNTGVTDPGNGAWDSTTVQTYTVPDGRRWALEGGTVTRDTATGTATLDVSVYDATPNIVAILDQAADATGTTSYPDPTYCGYRNFPMILPAGWTVVITIGQAQGAAAAATCHVREV